MASSTGHRCDIYHLGKRSQPENALDLDLSNILQNPLTARADSPPNVHKQSGNGLSRQLSARQPAKHSRKPSLRLAEGMGRKLPGRAVEQPSRPLIQDSTITYSTQKSATVSQAAALPGATVSLQRSPSRTQQYSSMSPFGDMKKYAYFPSVGAQLQLEVGSPGPILEDDGSFSINSGSNNTLDSVLSVVDDMPQTPLTSPTFKAHSRERSRINSEIPDMAEMEKKIAHLGLQESSTIGIVPIMLDLNSHQRLRSSSSMPTIPVSTTRSPTTFPIKRPPTSKSYTRPELSPLNQRPWSPPPSDDVSLSLSRGRSQTSATFPPISTRARSKSRARRKSIGKPPLRLHKPLPTVPQRRRMHAMPHIFSQSASADLMVSTEGNVEPKLSKTRSKRKHSDAVKREHSVKKPKMETPLVHVERRGNMAETEERKARQPAKKKSMMFGSFWRRAFGRKSCDCAMRGMKLVFCNFVNPVSHLPELHPIQYQKSGAMPTGAGKVLGIINSIQFQASTLSGLVHCTDQWTVAS
ncbi:hypothetical protein BT63DRAFT_436438 [Microthyrium microscopicum]|uniref:Uncharacterized protein n=1 Tax=Microthyrium microscopicum TaxID=703497 RepID=A0A6A6UX49_9PEZI|nr:hypothetical protein BT63DRAFT_436438 [Microthyrium microscopicum]